MGPTPIAALVALDLQDRPRRASLLRIYPDVEHPNYGAGALVTLLPPIIFDPDVIPNVVNELNLAGYTAGVAAVCSARGARTLPTRDGTPLRSLRFCRPCWQSRTCSRTKWSFKP